MPSSSRHMAIVGLLAIASIPWLASAKATSTLVGYTDPATVPNIEQVAFNEFDQVAYGVQGKKLRLLEVREVIAAALRRTPASAPNMAVLNTIDTDADIQDVAFCSSPRGSFVAICTEGIGGKTTPGHVILYRTTSDRTKLKEVAKVTVGALPDQLTFRKEGSRCAQILVANEGEPSNYSEPGNPANDPDGSISVIDIKYKGSSVDLEVATAGFTAFNGLQNALNEEGVRIFGPGATVAQDLEPECVTYSGDGKWAYASLQENNALAVIRLKGEGAPRVIDLLPLGLSDYKAGNPNNNALDPSDRDNVPQGFPNNNAKINQWPVYGLYQPDEIEAFTHKGDTYLVLANEGDAREDWVPYVESKRVADAGLDPKVFPDAAELVKPGALGRLLVSTALTSGSDLTSIRAFGARSFSILRMFKNGKGYSMVYNSGRLLEELTKDLDATSPVNDTCTLRNGALFNYGNAAGCFDARSPSKGPEPEGLDIAVVDGRRLLFLTLERVDLVAIFDISNPKYPQFLEFLRAPGTGPFPPSVSRRWSGPEGVTYGSVRVGGGKNGYPNSYGYQRGRGTTLHLVFTAWEVAPANVGPGGVGGGLTVHALPRRK